MRPLLDGRSSVSIVICCYTEERWDDLRAAVESACGQQPPVDEVLVVVDNNRSLYERAETAFSSLNPSPRIVENAGARGLSTARNVGIAQSSGDIVAFLDDDAVAAPDMIAALTARLAEPSVLGASALIVPEWRGSEPGWFPREFLWAVGCTYQGQRPGTVRNLIGAAMAIRRHVFETAGGFNAELGRGDGPLPLGCEETELCIRAMRSHPGGRFVYEAAALCRHKVGGERLTFGYLMRRCYAEGLSKARLSALLPQGTALATERAYVLRTLPKGVGTGLIDLFSGRIGGLGRAASICAAFLATLSGFVIGRARSRTPGAAVGTVAASAGKAS